MLQDWGWTPLIFARTMPLTQSEDTSDTHTMGRESRGQACCLKTQCRKQSPQQRITQPQMPVMPRQGNLGLSNGGCKHRTNVQCGHLHYIPSTACSTVIDICWLLNKLPLCSWDIRVIEIKKNEKGIIIIYVISKITKQN